MFCRFVSLKQVTEFAGMMRDNDRIEVLLCSFQFVQEEICPKTSHDDCRSNPSRPELADKWAWPMRIAHNDIRLEAEDRLQKAPKMSLNSPEAVLLRIIWDEQTGASEETWGSL